MFGRPSALLTLDDFLTKFVMDIMSLDGTQKSYVIISYNLLAMCRTRFSVSWWRRLRTCQNVVTTGTMFELL